MNFYKKTIFIFILLTFFMVVLIKMVEPVIDKQISGIFSDRKLSNKIKKELVSSTENFTEEKRLFYKDIIKKIYIKWKPLIEESITEANQELNK
tara:strand:- start:1684 stop:1965 length:282 start_codon:yes stop_codon:yes gene_type:complete